MLFVPAARRMAFEAAKVAHRNQCRAISSSTARLAQAATAAPVVVKKGGVGGVKGGWVSLQSNPISLLDDIPLEITSPQLVEVKVSSEC